MDPAGLLDEIIEATTAINYGRKGYATRGKAEEGRLSYERGISVLSQELQFCDETDT